jgi:hypothetical protein
MLVRGIDEPQIDAVRSRAGVGRVEVRSPTLDEIFVAYMRPSDESVAQQPPLSKETESQ